HRTPGYYTEQHAELAMAFGQQVASALDNAQLHARTEELAARTERQARELTALLEVARAVTSTLELGPLTGLILDRLRAVVEDDAASVFTYAEGETRELEYRGPLPHEVVVGSRYRLAEWGTVVEEAIRRRGPVLVEDFGGSTPALRSLQSRGIPLPVEAADVGRAVLEVPLIVKGEIVGHLGLAHHTSGYYTGEHAQRAMAFALQVGTALENARLYDQAERQARERSTLLDVSGTIGSTLE